LDRASVAFEDALPRISWARAGEEEIEDNNGIEAEAAAKNWRRLAPPQG
jgi:hypothetical protein